MNKAEKITKDIIRLPIYSLLIFAIILGLVFIFFVKIDKEKEVDDYKNILLSVKKELSKVEVINTISEIDNDYKQLLNKEKDEIKHRVYEADNIIKRVIKNNPNLPKRKLKEIIKEILSAIRFKGGDGYYFVYNYSTNKVLVHPLEKFLNKNMTNFKDAKGTNITKEFSKIIKKNREGFLKIYFVKPNDSRKEYKKIVFIKYIAKLNWVVGTGFYIDDVIKEFKKEQLKEISEKRYANNQYFFVIDSKSCKILANSYFKSEIGKKRCNLKDVKGNYFIKKFREVALNGGGFVTYYWRNPSNNKIEKKISYVDIYPRFNWIIGSGVYISDIEKIINKQKKEIIEETFLFYSIFFGIFITIFFVVLFFAYRLAKKVEKTFNIYKQDLENRVENAVKDSIKKDKMLQEQSKLAQMGEMIGMIAHQWRQPLNAIALNIQALPEFFECCEDNEECDKFIESNMKTIKFMSDTIDEFRNFFKSDKEKEKFSIKNELEKVKNLVSAQLKNHDIELEIKGSDFEVVGYKNQFMQVVLNLITNAKDAILENKIKNGTIEIVLDKENRRIFIKDNGGGIKIEDINRVFEPYFSTKGVQGTGLGLYMSKMILRNMDADIQAKNSENGAEFIIDFYKKDNK